ncbi:caspase domain-containing protein [Russula ochroleuca]|uniref:Caspase domain-containing protein n=1 Tax=Russula ochroleuca TaxID=152965 RepID=A0A9P5JXS9_9AGAM|nr:caspase domain-containing protein [Russula ochroleuca]
MAFLLEAPHSLRSRVPPDTLPPNHKALLLGISYLLPPEDSESGSRPNPLEGPLNDTKEMKTMLIDLFRYREQDIFVMTDEEKNVGTEHWPSKENILRAMDNLVRDATPGDAFVFYYAGHGGRDDVGGKGAYILTCDDQKILDHDIRKHLVDPLTKGCRMTAILDACYSGMLLNLEHYDCHCFIRRRSQSFSEKRKHLTPNKPAKRRHSEAALRPWVMRNDAHLRSAFKRAATIARVVIRLKFLVANKPKNLQDVDGPPTPRSRCGSCFCIYELLNSPLVISVSACSFNESTWDDSERKGKGMTVKLIKILRQNPSIQVGDLDEQLKKCLSKLAFKRVRKVRAAFRTYTAMLPHEKRIKLEQKYASQGVFDFKSQTAQFGSLHPLRRNDQFILERCHTGDLFH